MIYVKKHLMSPKNPISKHSAVLRRWPKVAQHRKTTSGLAFWPYWFSFGRSHPKFSFKSIFAFGWVTVTDFMKPKTQCSSHPSHETLHFDQQTPWFHHEIMGFVVKGMKISCKSFNSSPSPNLSFPALASPVLSWWIMSRLDATVSQVWKKWRICIIFRICRNSCMPSVQCIFQTRVQ